VIASFVCAVGVALALTPASARLALRLGFVDRPVGWKTHAYPTPYLGGAAIVVSFTAAVVVGGTAPRLLPVLLLAGLLWVVGTVDDGVGLSASARLGVEAAAGVALWASGLAWTLFDSDIANLAASALWIVAVVNALNLLDLMDGVAASVAAVAGGGAALMALARGDESLAILGLSLCGACVGFLPFNLRRPPRVFLGDGGSMPIGFILAAAIMAIPARGGPGWPSALVGALLVGLPLLDMGFRVVSRRRRRIPLMTAAPDSVANYLLGRLGSPRRVAAALAVTQALVSLGAVAAAEFNRGSLIAAWILWFGVGTGTVLLLDARRWAPGGHETVERGRPPRRPIATPGRPRPRLVEALVVLFIGVSCGLSPFLYGFYDIGTWGPIALLTLAILLGLVLSRERLPTRSGLVALGALAVLWLWSLLSSSWAESADQAMEGANRWLLYAALFGILLLLVETTALGRLVLAVTGLATAILALYLVVRMAVGEGSGLFLNGRLNGPLGYINGQAGYLLLGFWPLVAVAERVNRRVMSATALGLATLLVAVAVLSETRAVVPAMVVSTGVMLAAIPGRRIRLAALMVVGLAVWATNKTLLDVYDGWQAGTAPPSEVLETAARSVLVVAAAAGVGWAGALTLGQRVLKALADAPARAAMVRSLPLVGCVLFIALAAVSVDRPAAKVKREYQAFVRLDRVRDETPRFVAGGGNRYDYWRIAFDQFQRDPVGGVGAGNYDLTYFVERRTSEDVRQPHSLELQTLGELGIVGGLALAAFLGVVISAFARQARLSRRPGSDRTIVVAAGGVFLVWLVHTSFDWLHLLPGVTGLALSAAAVLVALPGQGARPAGVWPRRTWVAVCSILVLLGAVTLGWLALAEHERARGAAVVRADPATALQRARRSLDFNEESLPTYYLLAAADARLGRYEPARSALLAAVGREPHDFVSWVLLGDLELRRGNLPSAVRFYRRAHQLNPRDPRITQLARDPRSFIPAPSG
jgi:UDP-GlcNAc:undecaprenyl-phosphate GlcNAc-1-phosphate transferase